MFYINSTERMLYKTLFEKEKKILEIFWKKVEKKSRKHSNEKQNSNQK